MDTQAFSPSAARMSFAEPQRYGFLIVSATLFLSEGLCEVLARQTWVTILGASGSAADAISLCQTLRPDFVLLDVAVEDGLPAVARFRAVVPEVRVVALAIAETEEDVVTWAQAGIAGYIPRTAGLADLVQLLEEIANGRQPCSSSVAFGMLQRFARDDVDQKRGWRRKAPEVSPLTRRELEITALISAGLSNKEIARRLNIGVSTTKSHVHNLLSKLNVQRRGQIAARKRSLERKLDISVLETLGAYSGRSRPPIPE